MTLVARIGLPFARYLVRLGTQLRKRVSSDMNLSEYLAQFGDTMARTGHGSSWGVAGGTYEVNGKEREGRIFTFVSVDPDHATRAERLLGSAGLLCETTLRFAGTPPVTVSLAVHGLTVGLRALIS